MSGYWTGILAILCINVVFAYSVYLPAAAGQLNLGGAGFMAIGAYVAAYGATTLEQPIWITIPAAAIVTGIIGFLMAFPILRTRGVYMVLATFAFAEIVAGIIGQPPLSGPPAMLVARPIANRLFQLGL